MNTESATFQTSRTIAATHERVYAAFASPVQLAAWWGPNGFSNEFEAFEFKPGGRWKFVMVGPDGARYENENIFVKLLPGVQVVIEHVCEPHFTLTVDLAAQDDGKATLLTWTQALDDATLATAIRHIVVPANEQNLDRLSAVLNS